MLYIDAISMERGLESGAGSGEWLYLPPRMATMRPLTPSATRFMATLANVIPTIESTASGSPERRSYVSSLASVSWPDRVWIADASTSAMLALCLCPKASAGPYSVSSPPSQIAPSAAMAKEYLLGLFFLSPTRSSTRWSRSNLYSGIRHRPQVTYAVYRAVKPASRPKMRKTPMRSYEPRVVRWRLIASFARVIAVEKPMQYSVPWTSLSMVFGTATILTPLSSRTWLKLRVSSPPIGIR